MSPAQRTMGSDRVRPKHISAVMKDKTNKPCEAMNRRESKSENESTCNEMFRQALHTYTLPSLLGGHSKCPVDDR